jgi:hypothetical protein
MGPAIFDYSKRLLILPVIQLIGGHCININLPRQYRNPRQPRAWETNSGLGRSSVYRFLVLVSIECYAENIQEMASEVEKVILSQRMSNLES